MVNLLPVVEKVTGPTSRVVAGHADAVGADAAREIVQRGL